MRPNCDGFMRVVAGVVFAAFACLLLGAATFGQTAATIQDALDTPVPQPGPEQPIPYSHKTHLALGLTCEGCHTNPDHGVMMTFPATSRCMGCHAKIARNKPAIEKLAEYDKAKAAVPWVRVYTVLPGVKWSHRKHLDAGINCLTCHGNVPDLQVMAKIKSVTTMGGCLNCHQNHGAPTTCVTCHPAWAPGMVVSK